MTYRVQLRHAGTGFDAWVPELPGCATTGATEEEALQNIRKAIRGRLDLESDPIEETATIIDREVSVARVHAKPAPVKPEELPGPIPLPGMPQIYLGAGIFGSAIIGLVFFFMIEKNASAVFLFLPMIVLAFGVLGLFFGALSLENRRAN